MKRTRSNSIALLYWIVCAIACFPAQGVGAQDSQPALEIGRTSLKIQAALKPLIEKVSPSVVDIESQFGKRSMGTVVSPDGFIIGKYSEATKDFHCFIGDKKIKGKLIAIHRGHDLALIKVDMTGLHPVTFSTSPVSLNPGKIVISMTNEKETAKLGIVSVTRQRFGIEQPIHDDGIDLGLTVSEYAVRGKGVANGYLYEMTGLQVERVYPRTVAERSGLLVGDVVQMVNGKNVYSRTELERFATSLRVGQELRIVAIRDGQRKELSTKISSFVPRMLHDRWGGGPFSDKRFGFQDVISHDSVIEPQDCGGPLFDLEGNIVGINISRSMRVATFAIGMQDVRKFILQVRPKANLKYSMDRPVASSSSR